MTSRKLEERIGRLLATGTYLSVGSLALGVAAAVASQQGVIPGDAVDPLLWIGIGVVILTPVARVGAAGLGFEGRGERELAAICVAILAVLGATVLIARAVG